MAVDIAPLKWRRMERGTVAGVGCERPPPDSNKDWGWVSKTKARIKGSQRNLGVQACEGDKKY